MTDDTFTLDTDETTSDEIASEPNALPAVGSRAHFLVSGFSYSVSLDAFAPASVSRRGQQIEVTRNLLDASMDRLGNSWLSLLGDRPAQIERYGRPIIAPGPTPPDLDPLDRSSAAAVDEERSRRIASVQYLPADERAQALRDIGRDLGRASESKTIFNVVPDYR